MKSSSKKLYQLNIWPGFVDVLATLLIVSIFTILISGIAQIYFNDILGKKRNQISELDNRISDIAEKLSLEIEKKKKLKKLNIQLVSTIKEKENEVLNIKTEIKKKVLSLKIEKQKNYNLTEKNTGLLNDLREKNKEIDIFQSKIKKKENIISGNLTKISNLEKNIIELSKQLNVLSNQLDESEKKDKINKVKIESLGKRLNVALAGKVQELREYQSIFLKKIKESIGDRSDVILSGDRFIFPSEIIFNTASDQIEEKGFIELKKISKSLIDISKIIPKEIDWVLRIDGHTDKRPIFNNNFQSNWHLSSSRAIKIVNFLISQGIPPSRLVAAGFGEYQPITEGDSEQAYKENRRIEIKLTNR